MLACVIVHITTMKLSDLFEVIYVGITVRKCTAVRCLYATYRTSSKSALKSSCYLKTPPCLLGDVICLRQKRNVNAPVTCFERVADFLSRTNEINDYLISLYCTVN